MFRLQFNLSHALLSLQPQWPLMQIEGGGNAGGGREELSADDILSKLNATDDNDKEELNEDDDNGKDKEKESKEENEEGEDKTEESDELAELEEELKEPTDDDLELKTPVNRRQLKTDYPDIFKKHPGLESTIYRERAYTELLPTIADAKEALASLQTLEAFDHDLRSGDTLGLFNAVKSVDANGFAKIVDNLLPNLAQADERAYYHVIGNVIKDTVENMVKFAKESGNEEVLGAASILHQFAFNTTKWEGKKRLSTDEVVDSSVTREKEELNKQRNEFEEGRKKEYISKTMTSVNNQVKSTIEKSIDSKDQMTSFVKTKAIEEVMNKAQKLLEKDNRFQQIVKQLELRAGKEKFTDEALNRIRSTYLNKYKGILLPIIKAVRNEALKGNVKRDVSSNGRTKDDNEEINDTTERANRDTTVRNNSSGNKNDRTKPLPGESSLDFLMRRGK